MSAVRLAAPSSDDEKVLIGLGFRPQRPGRMGLFGNFALSFSAISVLSGPMTLLGLALATGGPASVTWSWVFVGLMALATGGALAEVTSAHPTSGALYSMASTLGGSRWGHYTGWFNLIGLVGALAAAPYGVAVILGGWLDLAFGFAPTPEKTFIIFALVLLLLGVLNMFGARLVSIVNSVSVGWHVLGAAVIVVALTIVPGHHQSAGHVFGEFTNGTSRGSPLSVGLLGLLLAQHTLSGYDASAHLSEETAHARIAAPRGILYSILVSWITGFVLVIGLLFAIPDYSGTVNITTGAPPAQVFTDALGQSAAAAMLLVVIAQLFCAYACLVSASRMIFAFSGDGALPYARAWRTVSLRTGTPLNAIWLAVACASLIALPSLWSTAAYAAVATINVLGIVPAYAIPIYLRRRAGGSFEPGPWHLGRWSKPIGWIAVGWAASVTILLCLPGISPNRLGPFNYASVALTMVLTVAWGTWHRNHHTITPEYGTPEASERLTRDIV
ncbi:amino acid permease [Streptomyces sp. NPDC101455]|uniref:amino acid permease n=1 Tax=Streptomyces sp. NPDC101455 TaxID=3366142 RepID=UPI00381220C7